MTGIVIRTIKGDFTGDLDHSPISDAVWLSLPQRFYINMLGSMIYFECPVDCPLDGERVTKLRKGDIAYWPKANALCFFFGPTPLSGDDGEPVAPYPVIVIGRLTGEYSGLEDAGDRQRITLDRAH